MTVLSRITAGEIKVPLKVPFKTALRTVDHVHSLVLLLETDNGLIGHGEAPATAVITGDLIDSMRAGLALLAPQLLGRSLDDFNALLRTVSTGLVHHTSLKAALEMALYDLRAQAFGVPLYALLGAPVRDRVTLETDVTISLNDTRTMVEDSRRAVAEGFNALKVKLGRAVSADDIAAVRAIHAVVGDKVKLRLDANQGWSPKQSVQIVNAIEHAGIAIEFVEQPVKASDVAGLKFVTEHTLAPILADEAVFSVRDALHLLETQSADIINIKLMKTGGISQAIEIANVTRRYHRSCMIGCMLESAISVAAAAHFAAAYADVVTLIDLDGPQLCKQLPVDGGIECDGRFIHLGRAPGLGVRAVHGLTNIVRY